MIPSLSAHLPYLWLVAASLIAGAMNAMAAGGSFISFPAMIAIGVPPIQANATNTVALWPGQVTSIWALRTDLRRDLLTVVVSAAILGGIGGAVVLLNTRPRTFMHIVPWMLLAASLLFWISGRSHAGCAAAPTLRTHRALRPWFRYFSRSSWSTSTSDTSAPARASSP